MLNLKISNLENNRVDTKIRLIIMCMSLEKAKNFEGKYPAFF